MPPAALLPSMIFELAAYGTVSSLLMRYVSLKNQLAKIYVSLLGAMLFGRVFYGAVNALLLSAGKYSLTIWLSAAFITAVLPFIPPDILKIIFVAVLGKSLKTAVFTFSRPFPQNKRTD